MCPEGLQRRADRRRRLPTTVHRTGSTARLGDEPEGRSDWPAFENLGGMVLTLRADARRVGLVQFPLQDRRSVR